jgi:two-component system alkaline phosphatase synthesis response regulator PhoP
MPAKILVVDDEPDTVTLLGMTLTRAGYTVLKATSGREGLTLALSERPDLLILDIMMPDLNGLDLLKTLRAEHGAPPPAVILFTAKSRMEDMAEGLQAGAYKYLVKPTSREKLLETVKAALAEAGK